MQSMPESISGVKIIGPTRPVQPSPPPSGGGDTGGRQKEPRKEKESEDSTEDQSPTIDEYV